MDNIINVVTKDFTTFPGAEQNEIEKVARELGITFPASYIEFIKHFNGAVGPIGSTGWISIWSIEKLVLLNQGYEVSTKVPGLVLFGGDGGGMGYCFDTTHEEVPIVEVDYICPKESACVCGSNFQDFLLKLSEE